MKRPALLALALSALSLSSASAQNSKDFSTVRFYPAVGPNNFIAVEGAQVAGHLRQSYGVFFDYSANTLVADKPCSGIPGALRCEDEKTQFVAGTGMFHLMAAVTLKERTQLSLDLPIGFTDADRFFTRVQVADGSSPSRTFAPSQGFAFADMRLAAKTRIWSDRRERFLVSASAFTTLPTGMLTSHGDCRDEGTCSFTGERGVNVGAQGIGEYRVGNFRTALNLGAAYRPHRKFVTRETGSELLYGVAGRYDLTPLVHLKAEVTGAVNLIGVDDHPIEARGALSYGRDLVVSVGGGGGLYGEVGSPSYRIFAGFQWTPVVRDNDKDGMDDRDDACPSQPEDRDGYQDSDGCPDPDNDGDGIPDAVDRCDDEREDFDDHEDEDGCPDPDNDGDGVPDGYDSCEGAKEDRDGDRDDDGCPDFDTDRDGVDDQVDACPDQPEDTDGLADEDGCPEEDFDGDGLKDTEDGCPDQPETWNGILDEDGCPEDDADGDSVPDQVDACEGQQETLNAIKDGDGCPDGTAVIKAEGLRLLPLGPIQFEEDRLTIEKVLVTAAADFIKRNHRRGSVRVVLTAPQGPARALRAQKLAETLAKRIQREVTSSHVVGSPSKLEIELIPPGLKALPGAAPAAPADSDAVPADAAAPSAPGAAASPEKGAADDAAAGEGAADKAAADKAPAGKAAPGKDAGQTPAAPTP